MARQRQSAAARLRLRGIGWDHERCLAPLRAASERWLDETGVEIVWEARSLLAFGDQPVEALARDFDLLSIDHPFVGTAHELRCLIPLDNVLPDSVLSSLAQDAIGRSHESYCYGGRQWALATDAACQVAAVRDDLLGDAAAPVTWEAVLDFARARPGAVAVPLRAADAISAFLSLCAAAGAAPPQRHDRFADPAAALSAIETLAELVARGHPASLEMDPPTTLERMTSEDAITYVPLAYGYALYAVAGRVCKPVRFLDVPAVAERPVGAILGGSGLAVSASCGHPLEAASFAAWVTRADVQRDVVVPAGGQPGSRSAWFDHASDRIAGGFFGATRASIENAYVRPRDPWWPDFQLAAGAILHDGLVGREPAAALVSKLERAYRLATST